MYEGVLWTDRNTKTFEQQTKTPQKASIRHPAELQYNSKQQRLEGCSDGNWLKIVKEAETTVTSHSRFSVFRLLFFLIAAAISDTYAPSQPL